MCCVVYTINRCREEHRNYRTCVMFCLTTFFNEIKCYTVTLKNVARLSRVIKLGIQVTSYK